MCRCLHACVVVTLLFNAATCATAQEVPLNVPIWPALAPGESSESVGVAEPLRPNEDPPITRLVNVRKPTMDIFLPKSPNGTAILVLPGGGFGKVVPDKEGGEAAPWLNELGVTCFVLRYRTNEATPKNEPAWKRPLQDSQRALRLIRSRATEWNIDPAKVGLLAFSAGGQVGSILHTRNGKSDYSPVDAVDQLSCNPSFSLLIYPWRILDATGEKLLSDITVTAKTPPAFIVHTHDDASSSLGSVLLYAELKRKNIPAELHIYANGGHGYGMRNVKDSFIGTWPDRASDWLQLRGLTAN